MHVHRGRRPQSATWTSERVCVCAYRNSTHIFKLNKNKEMLFIFLFVRSLHLSRLTLVCLSSASNALYYYIIIIIYLVIFHKKPLSIHLMFIHCSVSRTLNLCATATVCRCHCYCCRTSSSMLYGPDSFCIMCERIGRVCVHDHGHSHRPTR